ncbi:methyl-accepting chemotaxis protein [Dickeya fangzhongdai]|uniref:Methyl-accepting chemotaxis protein n=1 Tax=Dickeya fangzhongdai TaxID=1778540 RepID=A0A2K8QQJ0_9GAMM|nr:methyl-accepting chemotaxis protein [Dickeya fangzhongdai]ATZ95754.1 methyl-accepting chemotaxis protein [Dickeya fangzhongdai]QOH49199.1 HAMP domain-containing protein [Dickeya fangzhongdai]QOH53502.1 HAMP domain-containing protein [Dickeya fangzhongdai]WOX99299.1 methyl-accepting chemotaxis protein [Dickeya fangzhongdai]WOY05549.1 methyl-accepting chemotaxis protein [Dickeya fangzhongdai]
MRLSDWRIGYRLGAGFAALAAMLLIVGILSILKLSSFHDNARDIVQEIYPKTVDANNLIENVSEGVRVFQQLLLVSGDDKIKSVTDQIPPVSQEITRLMSELEKYANESNNAKIQQVISDIRTIRADFLSSGQKVIALVKANDRDAAINEFNDHLNPLQKAYRKAVRQLVDYQDDMMMSTVDSMSATYHEIRLVLLAILGVGVALSVWIALAITRSVTQPIQQALVMADRVSQGDLTSQISTSRKDEAGLLLQALDNMNDSLRQIVGQVRDGAEAISTAASQIAAGNQDLSSRTEEQASSLEQTAASMEELVSTIKNTAENTQQATSIANQASSAAHRSGEVMLSVTNKMRSIREASMRMAEIIGVIDGIAFQTNILALNAAVEAARAGEQGRGFAVVAGEVRSLAQRSATAAKEIKELIDDSVDKIQEGMQLVDTAESTMDGLTGHVKDVHSIINEISQASHEQSDGISQINIAVGQIDTTTQQNAALVEESASAALSLQSQASLLAEAVSAFRLTPQGSNGAPSPARRTAALSHALPSAASVRPVATEKRAAATAGSNDDWTSF